MKRTLKCTAKAIGVVAAVAIYFHFNVGNEVTVLFKTVAAKMVPWVNITIYS